MLQSASKTVIANSLVEEGLYMTANIIKELFPDAVISIVADVYPKHDTPYHVGISLNEVNSILGASYTTDAVEKTLTQLSFPFEKIIPESYMKKLYPTLVGKAYKNPSSMREDAPEAFSCSSLISYLYKGIWMPSLSVDKFVYAQKISPEEARFGDLVFANTGEGKIRYESVEFLRGTSVLDGVDHVGMCLGDGTILHATKVTGKVIVETLEEFSVNRTVIGYGRVCDDVTEERYVVAVPSERLDIRIKEDLAEEIGRIIGYDTLVPSLPKLAHPGLLPKRTYYENKVREILLSCGYSEVMTYAFGDTGEVELVKGLADDKEKLRTNLGAGVLQSLALNLYNAPLLGQKVVKIFEFGNVFTKSNERKHFALALDDGGKKSSFTEEVDLILSEIKRTLGVKNIECDTVSAKPYCIELDFDTLLEQLPEPTTYEAPTFASPPNTTYKTVSPYPFITRDIAMWVPGGVTWESIHALCAEVDHPLVARIDLFDTFSKKVEDVERTSYAFRLVFQSYEKTLTDDQVNVMMQPYYDLFKNKGYEIR